MSVVVLPAGNVQEAIEAIRSMIVDGARAEDVRGALAEAVAERKRETGEAQPDRRAVLQRLYGELAERFVYVDDPAGDELVQAPHVTLQRGGDCSSATVLVLSFARGLGLRTRLVVVVTPEAGVLRASHVYGEAETGPGVWDALDLAEAMPYGEAQAVPAGARLQRYPVLPEGKGFGFLDAILGLVGVGLNASATRDASRQAVKSAEIGAAAVQYQANSQERQIASQVQGAVDVATINAYAGLGQAKQAGATLARVLAFAGQVWPAVAALVALKAVVPVVAGRRAA